MSQGTSFNGYGQEFPGPVLAGNTIPALRDFCSSTREWTEREFVRIHAQTEIITSGSAGLKWYIERFDYRDINTRAWSAVDTTNWNITYPKFITDEETGYYPVLLGLIKPLVAFSSAEARVTEVHLNGFMFQDWGETNFAGTLAWGGGGLLGVPIQASNYSPFAIPDEGYFFRHRGFYWQFNVVCSEVLNPHPVFNAGLVETYWLTAPVKFPTQYMADNPI